LADSAKFVLQDEKFEDMISMNAVAAISDTHQDEIDD